MADRANAKSDPAAWISDCIRDYVASGENSLNLDDGKEPAWDEPLVGFSRGDDPLYQRFKEDIGPFFWTPSEVFAATFPNVQAAPDELTVISWVLPQTEQTRLDNRGETTLPAETVGAFAQIWGGLQCEASQPYRRRAPYGRARSGCAHDFTPLEVGKIRALRFCLFLVGAACGVCLRSGDVRALRRPDYAPGKGDALRLRSSADRHPSVSAALRRSPCLLPFLFRRQLRKMHEALPGGRHHPGGA